MDLIDFIRLKNLIERTIKKKVDLVEYHCIRKEIKDNVLNDEIPILRWKGTINCILMTSKKVSDI